MNNRMMQAALAALALECKGDDMVDQLERKTVPIEIKSISGGAIEGYASLFGQTDQGGDQIVKGAFAKSLRAKKAGKSRVKMLWQHDPSKPIGVWDEVVEDDRGLLVKGRILSDVEKGREAIALVEAGAIDGLSIGYRTIKATRDAAGVRSLTELEIWEVSLVTFPMLVTARIDGIKAAELTRVEFERKLTHDAGFTRSVARALMGGGLGAVKAMHDAGGGIDLELVELLKARCKSENQ